jgi:hypothetical protein
VTKLIAEPNALLAMTSYPYRILRWKDDTWTPLLSELGGDYTELRGFTAGPGWIVASGCFESVDGVQADDIAVHDGQRWWRVGSGGEICTSLADIERWGSGYVMAGGFEMVGGGVSYRLALHDVHPLTDAPAARPGARLAILYPNHPNPFNPHTTISYTLHSEASSRMCIYDLAGRRIRELHVPALRSAGTYELIWDARDDTGITVASGVYVARLETSVGNQSRKMVLIK